MGGQEKVGGGSDWVIDTHTHSVGTETETEIKHGRDGGGGLGGRNVLHAAISIWNKMEIKFKH